jgi:hypothetical protein
MPSVKSVQQNSTNSTPQELTPKQTEVIAALARGSTVTDAAKLAGIDRTTVYIWLNASAQFVAQLNQVRQERRDALRAKLGELASEAVSVVGDVLKHEGTPPGVRLKAALSVLQAVGALETEGIGSLDADSIEADFKNRALFNAITGGF